MLRPHDLWHGMRGAHAPAAATSLLLAVFAAMRDLAGQLRAAGHGVHYLTIDDPDNRQAVSDNLDALMVRFSIRAFEYQAPDEWRLDAQRADCGRRQTIPCRCPPALAIPVRVATRSRRRGFRRGYPSAVKRPSLPPHMV
jgi:hypothetical protein